MNLISISIPERTVQATSIRGAVTMYVEHFPATARNHQDVCQWCGLPAHLTNVGTYRFCAACADEAGE